MVPPAQKHEVGQLIRAAIGPMDDVMSVGPCRRTITTLKPATLVPHQQRPHSRRRYGPPRAPGIDLVRLRAAKDRRDRAVAGEATSGLGRYRLRPLQLRRGRTRLLAQRRHLDGDHQMRLLTARLWGP